MLNAREEKTIQALKHCAKTECYACPYRHDPECVPRVTAEAKALIERLLKIIPEERTTCEH